ncbi:flavin reductase family protein [Actinoplanes derwentensis]|uniref:NADH-FMN oxidoreductase RutF, flavin reductase (DIM6/NTAB) family n=1 Tax=Actinoplanes derwentensis TaxID=113562 RepID=A0A1H2B9I5_9ACTN|nr:flavin reductase [Actinoplanes derwentensis]GID86481.1 hypothetical protein Ade03nite_54050 [Actinoplanes derwentensis]SDT54945.1 NADH-FMN oxidoreductase RutF, flavin reductase (DIM6/NTAB) family [Actinoplanes derwentensis]
MNSSWRQSTGTVGLVAVDGPRGVNVMACEWSYFVNKDPVWVAVILGPRTASKALIEAAGRFAVTFCCEAQAALADFVGSCSVTEVDKATSGALTLEPGEHTPYVAGGVVAVECELRQIVPLPVHTMYLARVTAEHLPPIAGRPLVKHRGMYGLGQALPRTEVVAATRRLDGDRARVIATGPPPDGRLDTEVRVPPGTWRVVVERGDAVPGTAAVLG